MKERRLFVIILAVAVVLVVIAAVFFFIKPKEFSDKDILKNPAGAMEFCKTSPLDKMDECYYNAAQILYENNPDVSIQACLAISDEGFKNKCIGDLANKEENQNKLLELCNKITNDNGFKQNCYGKIDTKSGELSIDAQLSMCDVMTGMNKDGCYRNIADGLWETSPLKAVEVCQKISGSEKDNCLNNFMSSPELIKANPAIAEEICSSSSLSTKSRCYNDFARALSGANPKQAAEICKKLSDDVQISDCYGSVWFSFDSVVLQNYDFTISLCNVLTLKKDDCLRRASGVFMNSDRTKAEAMCKLMSASASSGCLNSVRR